MMRMGGNPDPVPEEDSQDLTDAEIQQAVATSELSGLVEVIRTFCEGCPECSQRMTVEGHALRRRKPNLFWRTTLKCDGQHHVRLTFQVNWMKEAHP